MILHTEKSIENILDTQVFHHLPQTISTLYPFSWRSDATSYIYVSMPPSLDVKSVSKSIFFVSGAIIFLHCSIRCLVLYVSAIFVHVCESLCHHFCSNFSIIVMSWTSGDPGFDERLYVSKTNGESHPF